ncbi:MAG: hypothetical protein GEU78_14545 [Actinobacteria bacterium]|nr:hypothetical protein [Actinomycetota bacterium]
MSRRKRSQDYLERQQIEDDSVDYATTIIELCCIRCQESGDRRRIGAIWRNRGIPGERVAYSARLIGEKVRLECDACTERDGMAQPRWIPVRDLQTALNVMEAAENWRDNRFV